MLFPPQCIFKRNDWNDSSHFSQQIYTIFKIPNLYFIPNQQAEYVCHSNISHFGGKIADKELQFKYNTEKLISLY